MLDAVGYIHDRIDAIGDLEEKFPFAYTQHQEEHHDYPDTRRSSGLPVDLPQQRTMSRFHGCLVFLAGFGWLINAMATFLFIYSIPTISQDITMSIEEMHFLAGTVFLGESVGSILFGPLGDYYGRKNAFLISLGIFAVAHSLSYVSWDYASMMCFRLLTGLGLGGQFPLILTWLYECTPRGLANRLLFLMELFPTIGLVFAAALSENYVPTAGWRSTASFAILPVFYGVLAYMYIPESPPFLASTGRIQKAVDIVDEMAATGRPLHAAQPSQASPNGSTHSTIADWSEAGADQHAGGLTPAMASLFPSLWKRYGLYGNLQATPWTIALWLFWFGVSFLTLTLYIWFPVTLFESNWFALVLILCAHLGGVSIMAMLMECLQATYVLLISLGGSFGSLLFLGWKLTEITATTTSIHDAYGTLLTLSCLFSFFLAGCGGVLYGITPACYPLSLRGMATSFPIAFGRFGAFMGAIMMSPVEEGEEFSSSLLVNRENVIWILAAVTGLLAVVHLMLVTCFQDAFVIHNQRNSSHATGTVQSPPSMKAVEMPLTPEPYASVLTHPKSAGPNLTGSGVVLFDINMVYRQTNDIEDLQSTYPSIDSESIILGRSTYTGTEMNEEGEEQEKKEEHDQFKRHASATTVLNVGLDAICEDLEATYSTF